MNRKGQTTSFLSVIPKPVLFIFFVLLLVVIGYVLSPIFNAAGIFCKSNGDIVKLTNSNIVSSVSLISGLPGVDEINGESINPDSFFIKCREYINGSYHFLANACSTCSILSIDAGSLVNIRGGYDVCEGDAYRVLREDLSWWNRVVNCPIADCVIPEDYYFEFDTGFYECDNVVGCASNTLSASRDKKLDDLGGVPLYTTEGVDTSYNRLFMFSCNEKLRVEPSVAGVPLFNPVFWLIIMLITIMVWGIINFAKK